MLEPAVTLTDYGLTIECWTLAAIVVRAEGVAAMRRHWIAFFAFIGAASLFGGTAHGFLHDESTLAYAIVWDADLLAIGLTAVAMWNLGALLMDSAPLQRVVRRAAPALLIVYATYVIFVSNVFRVGMAMYLPATVCLTVAMVLAHVRDSSRGWGIGIVGLGLTYVAAAVQQLGIDVDPVYFNHNALYHAIQAVALLLLYLAQARASRAYG